MIQLDCPWCSQITQNSLENISLWDLNKLFSLQTYYSYALAERNVSSWNISLVFLASRRWLLLFPNSHGVRDVLFSQVNCRYLEGRFQGQLNLAPAPSPFPPSRVPSTIPYEEHKLNVCKWLNESVSECKLVWFWVFFFFCSYCRPQRLIICYKLYGHLSNTLRLISKFQVVIPWWLLLMNLI